MAWIDQQDRLSPLDTTGAAVIGMTMHRKVLVFPKLGFDLRATLDRLRDGQMVWSRELAVETAYHLFHDHLSGRYDCITPSLGEALLRKEFGTSYDLLAELVE